MQGQQPTTPPPNTPSQDRTPFLQKVKFFIKHCRSHSIQGIKSVRAGQGFALLSKGETAPFQDALGLIFDCSFQEFTKQAIQNGFGIRKLSRKREGEMVTLFLWKQNLFKEEDQVALSEWSEQEQSDVKEGNTDKAPVQNVTLVKPSFVKPIVINKFQSEGSIGLAESKKEDASIDIRLSQPQFISSANASFVAAELEDACPLELSQRIRLERESYENCGRLIEGTIVEILEAHRSKILGQKKEKLMDRVVQIYDRLSDSIENSGGAVKLAGRGVLGQQEKGDE